MIEWISIKKKKPPQDRTPVLVYLEKPLHNSRVHTGYFGNVSIIGGVFSFDAPKVTHWAEIPNLPEDIDIYAERGELLCKVFGIDLTMPGEFRDTGLAMQDFEKDVSDLVQEYGERNCSDSWLEHKLYLLWDRIRAVFGNGVNKIEEDIDTDSCDGYLKLTLEASKDWDGPKDKNGRGILAPEIE